MLLGTQMPGLSPAHAADSNVTHDGFGMEQLVPDLEGIYRTALAKPFQEAEKKIYDEDIAGFYHSLLVETGLNLDEEN